MVLLSFDLLWDNYGTMENIYGTTDKTVVLYLKLWYYTENYGTSINKGKKVDNQKLRIFDL